MAVGVNWRRPKRADNGLPHFVEAIKEILAANSVEGLMGKAEQGI